MSADDRIDAMESSTVVRLAANSSLHLMLLHACGTGINFDSRKRSLHDGLLVEPSVKNRYFYPISSSCKRENQRTHTSPDVATYSAGNGSRASHGQNPILGYAILMKKQH
jgi:hypothetical protein